MTNEERLKAGGWHVNGAKCVTSRAWTKDRIDFYTESEALVVVLTAERDAAIARAERAEAQLDVRLPPGLFAEYTRLDLAWQSLVRDRDALRARAEAAEALAASKPDITPEMADVLMSVVDDAECEYALVKSSSSKTIGAVTNALSALRAHAAKVSR